MLRDLFLQPWGCLTSLKSQTWDPRPKVPPARFLFRIFTSWKKNPSTSVGFEPCGCGNKTHVYKTITFIVMVYDSETWSFTSREELRPRIFQNRTLGRIFGIQREWGRGVKKASPWRTLLRWLGHKARMKEGMNAFKF